MAVHTIYLQEQRASCADGDTAVAQESIHVARRSRQESRSRLHCPLDFPLGSEQGTHKWLAYYVSLSRPHSFSQPLSHGLPERDVIEPGPPEGIAKAFQELFADKIAKTKVACAQACQEMGWPARKDA